MRSNGQVLGTPKTPKAYNPFLAQRRVQASGFGLRVSGFGFRVSGFGSRV